VLNPDGPTVDVGIYGLGIPVLGICYGMQRMAKDLGGEVVRFPSTEKETVLMKFEEDFLEQNEPSPLFDGFTVAGVDVWMSHSCQVRVLPPGFRHVGSTKETHYAAMERDNLYAVQFHPEKMNHGSGKQLMNNFFRICKNHAHLQEE